MKWNRLCLCIQLDSTKSNSQRTWRNESKNGDQNKPFKYVEQIKLAFPLPFQVNENPVHLILKAKNQTSSTETWTNYIYHYVFLWVFYKISSLEACAFCNTAGSILFGKSCKRHWRCFAKVAFKMSSRQQAIFSFQTIFLFCTAVAGRMENR